MLKKILSGVICLYAFSLMAALPIQLDDTKNYTVIIPEKASQQEQFSAQLLAEYLGRLYRTKISVQTEKDGLSGPMISIGETRLAKKNGFIDKSPPQSYRFDVKEDNLFIRGGDPGPLNGVISFLEEDLGCRWYGEPYDNIPGHKEPGLTVIPDLSGKKLTVTPRSYTPPFTIREATFMYGVRANPESVLFFRQAPISYHSYLPADSGGVLNSSLFIHTYTRLVPPSKYFSEHPEYFALQNGKRIPQTVTSGSVCYTNLSVPKIMSEKILEEHRKFPDAKYFSISMNDSATPMCECGNCAPLIRKVGLQGIQLLLANHVAEILMKEIPDLKITTLIYGSGELKSSGVKAHPNVYLFLAPIGARYNVVKMLIPLQENENVVRGLENCKESSEKIIFWDYIDFSGRPYPTFDQIRDSLRYLASQKVAGYFADCTNGGVSLTPLKKWVYSHLLWDPRLDMEPLITEFINAYYGEAAPELAEYVSVIRTAWHRFKTEYDKAGGNGVMLQYTPEEDAKMRVLFERAMKKAEKNETLKGRIAREYLVFLAKELSGNPVVTGVDQYRKDYETAKMLLPYTPKNSCFFSQKLAEKWKAKQAWVNRRREENEYSRNTVTVRMPTVVAGMSSYATDPASSAGKASKHYGGAPWGIQWKYSTFIDYLIPGKTYVMRLRVRPEVKKPRTSGRMFELMAFHHGNEPLNRSQPRFCADFTEEDAKGGYRWIPVGKVKFKNPNSSGMFWMNTLVYKDEAVWYDSLELIPLDEYKKPEEVPNVTIQL